MLRFAADIDPARCQVFAEEMTALLEVPVTALDDFAEGTLESQVIVTCTSSRSAFLEQRHLQPGAFVAAAGADGDDEQELDPALMGSSKVVVDILEQCARIGELRHALVARTMDRSQVHADLGEVVSGARPGRTSAAETIVFDSTGSAIQDVAAAGVIYERALQRGPGLSVVGS